VWGVGVPGEGATFYFTLADQAGSASPPGDALRLD